MTDKQLTHEEMIEEAARREAKNKAWAAVDKLYDENDECLKKLAEIEQKELEENKEPFYRFLVAEYFATGEGITYYLQISRNYPPYNGVDEQLEEFKRFIGVEYYSSCIEEKTEEEFMKQYEVLIPSYVVKAVERKDQPAFTFQTHLHVNYS